VGGDEGRCGGEGDSHAPILPRSGDLVLTISAMPHGARSRSASKLACCHGKIDTTGRWTPMDPMLDQIGPRLRAARRKANLTLDQVAAATAISASTISRLEAGKRQPNLELIVPLARALKIGLDELIPQTVPDPRVKREVRRVGRQSVIPLSPETSPVQTFKQTIPASQSKPAVRTHDGYEWLYVLSGRLRLVLARHDLVLTAGEAAEFDTRVPHWVGSTGEGPVEILSIFSKEGQRIHLRAKPAARRG
jgi:transcriptional regulator with XRE-family HTH domain